MITMRNLFYRSIEYKMPSKQRELSLEAIFQKWDNGSFEGEIILIKKKSEQHLIYRYLVGKGGIIYIEMLKKDDFLKVEIKETPLGFFLPITLLLVGIVMVVIKKIEMAILLFLSSLFFLVFLYIVFINSSVQIIEKIEGKGLRKIVG